jgi:hypothetical protein
MRVLTVLFILVFSTASCKKTTVEPPKNKIPEGATPFTDNDILFVSYTSESPVFISQFNDTLRLNFIERKRTQEYYAWDQTYFTFSTNPSLKMELRLRYLQSDVSKKTLAIYLPYLDNSNVLRNNLFEMPIDYTNVEQSFFANVVKFYDTLMVAGTERYNVYEVTELVSTDASKDGAKNFSKVMYNRSYGLLQMYQKDGIVWSLN